MSLALNRILVTFALFLSASHFAVANQEVVSTGYCSGGCSAGYLCVAEKDAELNVDYECELPQNTSSFANPGSCNNGQTCNAGYSCIAHTDAELNVDYECEAPQFTGPFADPGSCNNGQSCNPGYTCVAETDAELNVDYECK